MNARLLSAPRAEPLYTSEQRTRDEAILRERAEAHAARAGVRLGDFIELPDGQLARVAYDWGEGVQYSLGGSFYLGLGYVDFSGSLEPTVPKALLKDTGRRAMGRFWFFSENLPRAGGGVTVEVERRVWRLEVEEDHG